MQSYKGSKKYRARMKMKKKSDNISSMQIIMERAIEKNPHNIKIVIIQISCLVEGD